MNIEKMQDLRRIAKDGGVPMSLRIQAVAKYEQELDEAVRKSHIYLRKFKGQDEDTQISKK